MKALFTLIVFALCLACTKNTISYECKDVGKQKVKAYRPKPRIYIDANGINIEYPQSKYTTHKKEKEKTGPNYGPKIW